MIVSILAAVADNGVMGRENALPWKLSTDLRRLKKLTMGHHVFMGRKTFESIGSVPLPGRTNIVITRQPGFHSAGVIAAGSIEEAIRLSQGDDEVFNLGGGEIFRAGLPLTDRLYITRVHAEVEGDTWFPLIDPKEWRIVDQEEHPADEKNQYAFAFAVYERRRPSSS
jgi:dihydrofolate reductase